MLFLLAVALPLPQGIWYFGRSPQWIVAIEYDQRLTVGPSDRPVLFGVVPLIVAKLLLVSVPVWLIWRYRLRRRRGGQPAAG